MTSVVLFSLLINFEFIQLAILLNFVQIVSENFEDLKN